MLSAPLPSVPPSTPSSVGYRTSRISSFNHNVLPSPPSALLASPNFIRSRTATSPLVRHRSESEQSLGSEVSETPSVEIISADIEDQFVTGRFESRDGSVVTRGTNVFNMVQLNKAHSAHRISPGISFRQAPLHATTSVIDYNGQDSSLLTSVSHTVPVVPNALTLIPSAMTQNVAHVMSPRDYTQQANHSPISSHSSNAHRSPHTSASSDIRDFEFSTASECSLSYAKMLATSELSATEGEGPQQTLPSQSSSTLRTPNVYINGLPPHFPDESLYAMTRDFGHVLSVRTFTRCVGDKMSGYGFVL